MNVMVHSRLDDVLHARNLTVDDPRRQIAARFDLAADIRTLDRLTHGERVSRPDVEIAAVAAALDVRLDDILLFIEGEIGCIGRTMRGMTSSRRGRANASQTSSTYAVGVP